MKKTPNISMKEIIVQAGMGRRVDHCLDEALALCIKHKINVVLLHNSQRHIYDYSAIRQMAMTPESK